MANKSKLLTVFLFSLMLVSSECNSYSKFVRDIGVRPNNKITNSFEKLSSSAQFKNEQYPLALRTQGGFSQPRSTLLTSGYLFLWYFFNVAYNIYNKKALNVWQAPWTLTTLQMGTGALFFVPLWILKIRAVPSITPAAMKSISVLGALHATGQSTGVVALGAGAVSFTHIVKSAEPAFTAVFSAIMFKQFFSWQVYSTLLPVCGGVALASAKEVSFNWISFGGAMASNLACSLRGILGKYSMSSLAGQTRNLTPANLYSVLTTFSAIFLLPLALIIEGKSIVPMWKTAVETGQVSCGQLSLYCLLSGIFCYGYNEVSFLFLSTVHPVTHAVAGVVRRVVVVVSALLFFRNPVTPLGAAGSVIALAGTFLYSLARIHFPRV